MNYLNRLAQTGRCPHCDRFIGKPDAFQGAPERDREAELRKRTQRRVLDVTPVKDENGETRALRFQKAEDHTEDMPS